ncbi:MAG: GGDEF domain protein [Nitrospirae bacterium]|nr:MAG: GGDEF domain protein [Nitrospirota bacterium]
MDLENKRLRAQYAELERRFLKRTAELESINAALSLEIAEKTRLEKTLKDNEERYRRMISAITTYTYSVLLEDGLAVSTTHSIGSLALTGYHPGDYERDPFLWHSMIHPEDRHLVEQQIQNLLAGNDVEPLEHRLFRRDGSLVWVRNSIIAHRDEHGRIIRYDGLVEDITPRKNIEQSLRDASLLDELTGLYNRRGFFMLAEHQIKTASRLERSILLFFIDLDRMKWINDTLGHAEGDSALIRTARALKATFRDSDIVARIGGDEFAVLTIENQEFNAEEILERIDLAIQAENAQPGAIAHLSLSIGMSRSTAEISAPLEELLARADSAMYEQKRKKQRARGA